ncbi:MAG: 1-acyl-sn-glycerol-3-phosphate acyltransferase, partial [Rubricoccaceae bacterium]|nr:1-acyl-sn-glycerol-3-phosphate acyltransferase [Rubricoccaceae bacterium]
MTGRGIARRFAASLVLRDLRRRFRRVVWIGEPPALPEGPVVVYANHHAFHDGYLLWHLLGHRLGRPFVLWMEQWDAVPLFGPLGALPFPAGDARRRAATVRETARRMTQDPKTVFLLFPEGVLGPPDAGLAPFRSDLTRLARLLPDATRWWPAAVRVTWWGDERPTALLTGGPLHDHPDGEERARLQALLDRLADARPAD